MRRSIGLFDFLKLDRRDTRTLNVQLFDAIRGAILDGTLPVGMPLPSSRNLAEDLQIARNTVTTAYEQLCVEGYLVSQQGSGTRVAELPKLQTIQAANYVVEEPSLRRIRLSRRGEGLCGSPRYLPRYEDRTFAAGLPALDLFPRALWARYLSRGARRTAIRRFDYSEVSGVPELKQSIADHLSTARGLRPDPEQIIVLNSAQAALDLLTRIVTDAGDTAWIEEPGYLGARGAFQGAGLSIRPIPVDDQGVEVPEALSIAPKLIYVTPSHHCPTGVMMSLERRLQLLETSRIHGALIIEDDYDSEFRYDGHPISTLWSLDQGRTVVYMGTFSKTMFPGLKLGYLVAPVELCASLTKALHHTGQSANKIVQLALAEFIAEGRFADHVRTMKKTYAARRSVFLDELQQCFGDLVSFTPTKTGMQQAVLLNSDISDVALSEAARSCGVTAPTLSRFFIGSQRKDGFFLGFASSNEDEIRAGMHKLSTVVKATGRND